MFNLRRISWSEIDRYEPRTDRPLREFGGWGIRWVPGKLASNVSRNQGVWIQRAGGRSVILESQHVEERLVNEVKPSSSRAPADITHRPPVSSNESHGKIG
jgi:hypothetical protein